MADIGQAVRYGDPVPHQTLEASVKALQVPALLVADVATADILAVNPLANKEISTNLLVGANLLAVFRELRFASEAFRQVCSGGKDLAVDRQKFNGSPPTWEVVSRLPEISGYPPSLFMTFHPSLETEGHAVSIHRRDSLAMECAILIDRTRSDLATQADMARMNYLQVEQMAKVWTARLTQIEELHKMTLSVAGDHPLS